MVVGIEDLHDVGEDAEGGREGGSEGGKVTRVIYIIQRKGGREGGREGGDVRGRAVFPRISTVAVRREGGRANVPREGCFASLFDGSSKEGESFVLWVVADVFELARA